MRYWASWSRRALAGVAGVCAVGLLMSPAAAHAADAVFGGALKGSDRYPIVLNADAKAQRLRSVVMAWSARCESGQRFTFGEQVAAVARRPGTVQLGRLVMSRNRRGSVRGSYQGTSDTSTGSRLVTVTFSGRLKRSSASGTLSAEVTFVDVPAFTPGPEPPAQVNVLDRCRSGTVRWSAAHRPGLVYGGRTAQDEPIVLRVAKDRLRVDEVGLAWFANCAQGGGVEYWEQFVRFPLSAGGAFGDSFTQRYPVDGGGENVYDYDLRGRLKRTSASGSFRAKVTLSGGDTCDSGPTRWSARST